MQSASEYRRLALICLLVVAGVWLVGAARTAVETHRFQDFETFYRSAVSYIHGERIYGSGQMNLPHFTLVVLPFTFLPLPSAFLLWTIINVVSIGVVGWWIAREFAHARTLSALLVAMLFSGTLAQIATANVGGLVALVVTCAWLANRSSRSTRAGFWLGLACAFKPFLGVMLIFWLSRRKWRSLIAALLTITGCAILGLVALGPEPYIEWWQTVGTARFTQPLNASLWLFLELIRSASFRIIVWLLSASLLISASSLLRTREHCWAALLIASLLLSPLGWIYYGWLAAGPVVAVWPTLRPITRTLAVALLCIPPIFTSVQGLYMTATVVLWISVAYAGWPHLAAKPDDASTLERG